MKKLSLILLVFAILTSSCEDSTRAPLPPETQTGVGMIACKVNEYSFIDRSDLLNCYYQYTGGEYAFAIGGRDRNYYRHPNIIPKFIDIIISREIKEGDVFPLVAYENNDINACAMVFFKGSETGGEMTFTDNENPGQVTITKFDTEKQIISGTFEFSVKNPYTGEIINFTEGRFDSYYTR